MKHVTFVSNLNTETLLQSLCHGLLWSNRLYKCSKERFCSGFIAKQDTFKALVLLPLFQNCSDMGEMHTVYTRMLTEKC